MDGTTTQIELGQTYEDKVTGFTGIATSIVLNLHEDPLVHLENEANSRWVTESRITQAS